MPREFGPRADTIITPPPEGVVGGEIKAKGEIKTNTMNLGDIERQFKTMRETKQGNAVVEMPSYIAEFIGYVRQTDPDAFKRLMKGGLSESDKIDRYVAFLKKEKGIKVVS